MLAKRAQWSALAFGLCLLVACSEKIEPGNTHPDAKSRIRTRLATATVSRQPIYYEATGTVTARTASTLSSKILGTVKAVKVREGDRVRKDDILVVLDQRQVDAGLSQAAAALDEARKGAAAAVSARQTAEAGAGLAAATFERYRRLMETDSVSRQEFDEITARHRQAQAALGQAEAMVNAAKSRIKQAEAAQSVTEVTQRDATLIAPYDGIITAKRVHAGDLAAPGTPMLDIQALEGFQVDISLPENTLGVVQVDQTVEVTIPALGATPIPATVETVVPVTTAMSRSFIAKVGLSARDGLISGMFARTRIPIDFQTILSVPVTSVIHQGQLTGMYLVGPDHTARFRLVRLGRTQEGDRVEILSGLAPDTVYVVTPSPQLVDGTLVEADS